MRTSLLLAVLIGASQAAPVRRNVMFVTADDLRPNLGAYGHKFMSTPNMDTFASEGTLFQRAYTQYPFCAPSRNSFMTGRRPDTTKAYSFRRDFRQVGPDWKSIPQYFKENGYYTGGTGKTFQQGLPINFDAPRSWDRYVYNSNCASKTLAGNRVVDSEGTENNVVCAAATGGCPDKVEGRRFKVGKFDVCAVDRSEYDAPLRDAVAVDATREFLEEAQRQDKPFFVHVGLYHPHLPWIYPQEFDDIYAATRRISLPRHRREPAGMPRSGYTGSKFGGDPTTAYRTRQFRRAYYSTVSYLDYNFGKLTEMLREFGHESNTAVVLTSDHGYHLGENNMWMKKNVMELSARVPLIIRAPWIENSVGVKTAAMAELVDMFQTLVDLAGLEQPSSEKLEGNSLVPLLEGTSTTVKPYAFTQQARDGWRSNLNAATGTCFGCELDKIEVMGYSVRANNWRYSLWARWNKSELRPNFNNLVGRELYDHKGDLGSNFDDSTPSRNLVNDEENKEIVECLHAVILDKFLHGKEDADLRSC